MIYINTGLRRRIDWDYDPDTLAYIARVETGGGTVRDPRFADMLVRLQKQLGIYDDCVAMMGARLGNTIRAAGSNLFSSRAWDASPLAFDLVQSTEAEQPRILGQSWGGWRRFFAGGTCSHLRNAPGFTALSMVNMPHADTINHGIFSIGTYSSDSNSLRISRFGNQDRVRHSIGISANKDTVSPGPNNLFSATNAMSIYSLIINSSGRHFFQNKSLLSTATLPASLPFADSSSTSIHIMNSVDNTSLDGPANIFLMWRTDIGTSAYDAIVDFLNQAY
jgi:hypothetical protein